MTKIDGLISVVIISFNGAGFIEDCLSSVRESLSGSESEIIVVDNGSDDATIDIIRTKYDFVLLIANETNRGFTAAVNQGLKKATGEYILLLNQDTKIIGKAIPDLVERIRWDEKTGVIGPGFISFDGHLQKSVRAFPRYRYLFFEFTGLSYIFSKSPLFSGWKMGWFDHLREREVDQPMGAALMLRRETINRVGIFDEQFKIFFSDVDYCRRVMEAGYINLYYPSAQIAHYVGGSTEKKKAAMIFESHHSLFKYFKKYSGGGLSYLSLCFWGAVLLTTACLRAGYHLIFRK